MSVLKNKRKRASMRCVLFPEDVKESFNHRSSAETSKAIRSWKCGDSFLNSSVLQNLQTTGKSTRTLQQLLIKGSCKQQDHERVHIAWSSSEEEPSDSESRLKIPPLSKSSKRRRTNTNPMSDSISRSHRFLSTGIDADEIPTIDSESEHEEDFSITEQSLAAVDDISDYSSDGNGISKSNRLKTSAQEPKDDHQSSVGKICPQSKQNSVSEWVRSAQALLQTPQKQMDPSSKTPKDSGGKRHKFVSQGLAERLNKLQCRQRSAISLWRHQSSSTVASEDRRGVLVLHVQNVWDVCGMQAALCERHDAKDLCIALFSKDTATHLEPTAGDTIHVYPPWQSLILEKEKHPIILNTHFSQKIFEASDRTCPRASFSKEKTRPYPLIRCLWKIKHKLGSSQAHIPNDQAWKDSEGVFESLMEVLDDCGPSGSLCGPVKVVVQRVYSSSGTPSSSTCLLKNKTSSKNYPGSAQQSYMKRICMLVQDAYGMFSEVELVGVSMDEEFKLWRDQVEGRVCVLQGLMVMLRLTRESRCTELFSFIDSLWPPLIPLKVHGEGSYCQTDQVSAPSFCYRLTGDQGCVIPQYESPLYHPPIIQTLKEILKDRSTSCWCSFRATLVYKKEMSSGERDLLLFVTDPSLQEEQNSGTKTVPVYVSSSCLLKSSIRAIISTSQPRPSLLFRDMFMDRGKIFQCQQSAVHLVSEHDLHPVTSMKNSLLLDELGPDSPPRSLCTLTGLIVDVDENSAFSWPNCSHCASDHLEADHQQDTFHCLSCGALDKPVMKMQLEVFLNCPSLNQYTLKVKLQQKTIMCLLNTTEFTKGYEVENVLGKEVGPLCAYIQMISRCPTQWMSLEEILLNK